VAGATSALLSAVGAATPPLQELCLHFAQGLTAAVLAHAVTACPDLRVLRLRACAVTEDALHSLTGCRSLHTLDLSRTWCTTPGTVLVPCREVVGV
jgi:hypothetical protein